jgi:hypothetical protein
MLYKIDGNHMKVSYESKADLTAFGKILWYFSFLAGLCMLLPFQLHAQNSATSTITGTVTDPTGAVVPAAAVSVVNEATQVVVSVKTTAAGDFTAPFLKPGSYEVTVTHPGFESFKHSHIDLPLDQTVRVDARLTVGKTSEEVAVTSSGVQLETETSELAVNFSNDLVENLPIE